MTSLIDRAIRVRRANRERSGITPASPSATRPQRAVATVVRQHAEAVKPVDHAADLFKFYEDAAEKTKAFAWAQTTWILTLNAGVLAFSLDFFANHADNAHFVLVEGISSGVGVALCLFLIYLLAQLGGHISHYWTSSNRLAASNAQLAALIFPEDLATARHGQRVPFPAFCRRLQFLAALFAAAHITWLILASMVLRPA
jgi:hypothetical protein